jgi:hypothetical protein
VCALVSTLLEVSGAHQEAEPQTKDHRALSVTTGGTLRFGARRSCFHPARSAPRLVGRLEDVQEKQAENANRRARVRSTKCAFASTTCHILGCAPACSRLSLRQGLPARAGLQARRWPLKLVEKANLQQHIAMQQTCHHLEPKLLRAGGRPAHRACAREARFIVQGRKLTKRSVRSKLPRMQKRFITCKASTRAQAAPTRAKAQKASDNAEDCA